ncbi:MAG: hypothetical protein QOG18_371 [Microbacteriaceae bacterium]|jgi:hypothetical protein|nr:hypothetical protein [Microbacteriaceae bacterium]MDQ1525758.1 hypothetical protein [Microbacteriaceae bacterium]
MTMPPDDKDPRKVSTTRIVLWVLVSGFAIYMIVSGIIGVIAHG